MKKAFLQLHGAILLAGLTGILGKLILLSEGYLVWYRMALSTLIFFTAYRLSKSYHLPNRKDLIKMLGIGTLLSLHWILFFGSIKYSNVSVAVTCYSAVGFFTSLFEPLINRHKIDPVEVFLGLLVICGIYLIFNFHPEFKKGIIFGIGCAIIGSVFPVLNKNMLKHYRPLTLNSFEMLGGTLALLLILPLYFIFFQAGYAIPTANDWLWLIILTVFCTFYAFQLSMKALEKLSPFTNNLSYNLEPIYSVILAFIIFKENQFLGAGFYYGFSLIIFAVFLQTIRVGNQHRQRRKNSPRTSSVVDEKELCSP